jgi:uncharacterized membrane protein YfcA
VDVALLMIAGGLAAGVFGSLLGLGGGILIVPLLTLGFDLPLREAVGVSLVSVIATSGASAGVYLQRHVANLRLGMTLELFVAFAIPDQALALLFAGLLTYVGVTMLRGLRPDAAAPASALDEEPVLQETSSTLARLSGPGYRVRHLWPGVGGSIFAGVISALLGVGGGIVKVPVMHLVMGVPLRVATATSNLMIGVTASASAIIYLLRGGIDPYVAGPTVLGVFVGATIGSRSAHRIDVRILRVLFVIVLFYTAWQMLNRGLA